MEKRKLKEITSLILYDLKRIYSKPTPFLMLGLVILLSLSVPVYFNKIITPSTMLSEIIVEPFSDNGNISTIIPDGLDKQQEIIASSYDQFMDTTDPDIVNTSNYKNMEKVLLYNVENHYEAGIFEKMSGISYFNFFSGNLTFILILIFSAIIVLNGDSEYTTAYLRQSGRDTSLHRFFSSSTAVFSVLTAPVLFFTLFYSIAYGTGPLDMLGLFNLKIKSGFPPEAAMTFIDYKNHIFLNALTMHGTISMLQGVLFMLFYQVLQIGAAVAFLMLLKRFINDRLLIIIIFFSSYFLVDRLAGSYVLNRTLDYLFLSYSSSFRDTLFIPDLYNYTYNSYVLTLVRDYFLGIAVMLTSTLTMLYIVITPFRNTATGGIVEDDT